ncbi:MAG TPA: DUF4412 domain-containing protein [Gemmatimonadales bacterium]|jgi:hypothetical protein|nr:DUF4412 domain-containing protein [Gemmatimonadales bacterium]
MNRIMLVPLLLAMSAVPAAAQGAFEGTVNGTMTASGKSIPFRYSQLGSRIRTEYSMEGHNVATIYDATTGDMTYVMPEQRKYMMLNMRDMSGMARQMAGAMGGRGHDAPDWSKVKVTATGQRETIAGIACEHYLFESTDDQQKHHQLDMCGASGLGFMGMAGQTKSLMPSTIAMLRSQNPDLARIARQGFFPLKMSTTESGEGSFTWTVTQIERGRPAAALFQPPAGYTELKMPGGHD